jgi:hypothetical protein
MTKLEQSMSAKAREELATFGERFIYLPDHGTNSYAGKDDIIDAIQPGILSRKVVRYRYADARGRGRDGFLGPLGMVLYAMACCGSMNHDAPGSLGHDQLVAHDDVIDLDTEALD